MIFYLSLSVSIVLMLAGFFAPPMGVIDGSVLTAVGLLLMFVTIAQIPPILNALGKGKSIKFQKGDFSVDVSAENR